MSKTAKTPRIPVYKGPPTVARSTQNLCLYQHRNLVSCSFCASLTMIPSKRAYPRDSCIPPDFGDFGLRHRQDTTHRPRNLQHDLASLEQQAPWPSHGRGRVPGRSQPLNNSTRIVVPESTSQWRLVSDPSKPKKAQATGVPSSSRINVLGSRSSVFLPLSC